MPTIEFSESLETLSAFSISDEAAGCHDQHQQGPRDPAAARGPANRARDASRPRPIPEPDETGITFWENARLKALPYAAATG